MHRTGGAVRRQPHVLRRDFQGQSFGLCRNLCTCARQADVGGLNPQILYQMENVQLLVQRRAVDGRRLQPIPQRFISEARPAGYDRAP